MKNPSMKLPPPLGVSVLLFVITLGLLALTAVVRGSPATSQPTDLPLPDR